MNGVYVWLPTPGETLVYRVDGFPMPPLDQPVYVRRVDLDAEEVVAVAVTRATLDYPGVSDWPWERDDVWPCSHVEMPTDDEPWLPFRICRRLAAYRHAGPSTRGYYCAAHVPTKPSGDQVSLCSVCAGPMDPWLTAHGYTSHHNCDPTHTCDSTEEATT